MYLRTSSYSGMVRSGGSVRLHRLSGWGDEAFADLTTLPVLFLLPNGRFSSESLDCTALIIHWVAL